MKKTPDESYHFRAGIGVGASLGTLIGTLLGALFFGTSLAAIIGMIIGAGLGAAVGTRLKSQAFQFLWIEYSRDVARRLIISGLLFLAPFSLFVYFLIIGTTPAIEILLISAASLGGLFMIYSIGYVISQLDDLLKKIILEGIVIGVGISLFIFLALGLINLAFPIPADWLIAFIIMGASILIGRIVAAVRYR
jgi:hypothetical protein